MATEERDGVGDVDHDASMEQVFVSMAAQETAAANIMAAVARAASQAAEAERAAQTAATAAQKTAAAMLLSLTPDFSMLHPVVHSDDDVSSASAMVDVADTWTDYNRDDALSTLQAENAALRGENALNRGRMRTILRMLLNTRAAHERLVDERAQLHAEIRRLRTVAAAAALADDVQGWD